MSYLKSKFKIFPIILISYFSVLPLLTIWLYFFTPNVSVILPVLFLSGVGFFWFKILRVRACSIKINKEQITLRHYFGIGKPLVYVNAELDGFTTVFESAKGTDYESIFILEKGKRIGCVSSFYHKNFENLKLGVKENLVDLGE
ncbi:hypothetical protein [Flavobacterium sp. KACC 22761]|uniref:hypothetical protein n=1 Tax=Flavobacterium sp. KACC 22761 TaxID=3092665 RepID=UPI002A766526|nr:hypothetical protein [Flavobacterium sp. KACC 22761]WPO79063.1 hypothetical protein SCB73_01460 [Flavobacterium sp. KACC 22761]